MLVLLIFLDPEHYVLYMMILIRQIQCQLFVGLEINGFDRQIQDEELCLDLRKIHFV